MLYKNLLLQFFCKPAAAIFLLHRNTHTAQEPDCLSSAAKKKLLSKKKTRCGLLRFFLNKSVCCSPNGLKRKWAAKNWAGPTLHDLIHPQDGNGAPSFAPINVPHYDLMRPHGRNGTSFENLRGADGASFNAPINFPINDPRFPEYGNGSPLGGFMEMWHHDHVPYDNQVQETPAPVLMPPQPELTNQDYFHPFSSTADIFPNHYSQVRYETESSSNIPDLSEVRQREGIPDLEDELEDDVKGGSCNGVSGTAPLRNGGDAGLASAEELKSGLNAIEGIAGVANTTEGGSSDALESNTMEEVNDKKKESLQEVVKEIKGAFLSTCNYGKEVSMLLESDKLPYQYTGSKFKGRLLIVSLFYYYNLSG